MTTARRITGILIAFCLLATIVTPAIAVSNENGRWKNGGTINEGMKNDLWNLHIKYRILFFQLRQERAEAMIDVLEDHGCDVGTLPTDLQEIEAYEKKLEDALNDHDWKGLRTINHELKDLWKDFRKEVKESIRTCREETA